MGSNTLEDLPLEALDKVLCLLAPPVLVHLHAATGAGTPAIAQRIITMRAVHHCAHHWLSGGGRELHLSQRLAQHSKESKHSRRCRCEPHHRGQMQHKINPYTKHELIKVLGSQIRHINDVAAFIYHWVPFQYLGWKCQIYDPIGTERDIESKHWVRLDSLNKKIHEALSLGYHGYLDFFGDREDPRNKVKETAPLIVAFIMI
ncbi:TPA: hypothetical protein ACH3X2_001847 [Trebouxia sp. C0005]